MNSAKKTATEIVSWLITLWACYVFLGSLPYKFTGHPDTQHIFGTIGEWMKGIVGDGLGGWFAESGALVVGSFELLTSVVLLLPAVMWVIGGINRYSALAKKITRAQFHQVGGLMAAAVMAGAVFFHLATPLGIEVLHQGVSDDGSLFFSAVSILVLGLVLFVINTLQLRGAR